MFPIFSISNHFSILDLGPNPSKSNGWLYRDPKPKNEWKYISFKYSSVFITSNVRLKPSKKEDFVNTETDLQRFSSSRRFAKFGLASIGEYCLTCNFCLRIGNCEGWVCIATYPGNPSSTFAGNLSLECAGGSDCTSLQLDDCRPSKYKNTKIQKYKKTYIQKKKIKKYKN